MNELSTRWRKVGDEFGEIETQCRLHILPLLYVIAMLALAMSGSPLVKSGFDSKHMPTATLAYIQEQHLDPRGGFNYDNWGGYIRYATGMPVFIDDRADFYGEKFYLEYARVSMVEPGWSDVLKKYNIQWVLFPNNSRLVARLSESPEWKVVKKDDAASLLERVK